MKRRVLGIDPGLATTGWGVIDSDGNRHSHIGHGIIETTPDHLSHERLKYIYQQLVEIIDTLKPVAIGVETLYFAKNSSSALAVAQARGVILLAASQSELEVGEYTPLEIKKSVTGSGRADKEQVRYMVNLLLGLDGLSQSDHASDALATAVTLAHNGVLWSIASAAG